MALESKPETGTAGSVQEKLALIIPTLREAANIRSVLDHTRRVLDPVGIPYEIIVVDDDSDDGTGDIVSAIALEDPRVRLIVRKGAKGVAGATLLGWHSTDATILGEMDADLQHPPGLLPELGFRNPREAVTRPSATGTSRVAVWATGIPPESLSLLQLYGSQCLCRENRFEPKTRRPASSWSAANASIKSSFSKQVSNCCLTFWFAAASAPSKKFHLNSGAAIWVQARQHLKWPANMAAC